MRVSILGQERSSGVGNGEPNSAIFPENSRDRGARAATVHEDETVDITVLPSTSLNIGGAFTDKTYHYVKAKNIL